MIILGLVLLVVGILTGISILTTIGVIGLDLATSPMVSAWGRKPAT